jgi:holo-[acyl-carrier protein] synthase
MIYGVGTDIVAVRRMADFWQRHGERGLEKMLAPEEREACRTSPNPARFLAKRFAAKEALGKAFGTGVRDPVLLPAIAVSHDDLGKPAFAFSPELAAHLAVRGLVAHLSVSDEQDYAVAFVILEKP